MTARYLALGVNGIGAALMVVIFTQTGGLTGAEVGIAGGSAALAQKLLEAVFGDENVRRMAKKAKDDLDQRVEVLMSSELLRYHQALVALQVRPQQAEQIRTAAQQVTDALAGGLEVDPYVTTGRTAELAAPGQAALAVPDQPAPAALEREASGASTDFGAADPLTAPHSGPGREPVREPVTREEARPSAPGRGMLARESDRQHHRGTGRGGGDVVDADVVDESGEER